MAGALGLALGACGDGDGNLSPDANVADANVADADPPDGPSANELRAGTIAITDMTISNPEMPFRGASVSITYRDLADPDVEPAFGEPTPPLGGCSVWIYQVGEQSEPPVIDEGPVTISGALSAIGTCSFDAAAGRYRCPAGQGTIPADSVVSPNANGTVSIVFPDGESFPDLEVVGMYAELAGFTNSVFNGRFPVVGQVQASNILVVANPAAVGQTPEVVEGAPTYTLYAGEGPTPASVSFLGGNDPEDVLSISKGAGAIVSEFSAAIVPSGEGLRLATGSAQPHELPSTAEELTFSCAAIDEGSCGSEGGIIHGFVLSGSTTDATVAELGPTTMPAPVSRYATFQCRGVPQSPTLVIPEEAMEAILSTKPTRIQTQLLRITADLSKPQTSIIVGHGLLGFTTVQQQ